MVTSPHCDSLRELIDMDMLDLQTTRGDSTRHEQVVKLLVLLVEDICVSLDGRDVRYFVDLMEDIVEWCEDGARHDELVAVSANDDVRIFILIKDRLDEVL